MSRSASKIGVYIFFRESHEPLLLSEEIVDIGVHRYVQYTQGGEGEMVVYVQGEKRRVGLNETGSHQGAMEQPVTLLVWLGTYCSAGLGKFNIIPIAPEGVRKEEGGLN